MRGLFTKATQKPLLKSNQKERGTMAGGLSGETLMVGSLGFGLCYLADILIGNYFSHFITVTHFIWISFHTWLRRKSFFLHARMSQCQSLCFCLSSLNLQIPRVQIWILLILDLKVPWEIFLGHLQAAGSNREAGPMACQKDPAVLQGMEVLAGPLQTQSWPR